MSERQPGSQRERERGSGSRKRDKDGHRGKEGGGRGAHGRIIKVGVDGEVAAEVRRQPPASPCLAAAR